MQCNISSGSQNYLASYTATCRAAVCVFTYMNIFRFCDQVLFMIYHSIFPV